MKISCLINKVSQHLIGNKSPFIPKWQASTRSRVYTTTTTTTTTTTVSPFIGEQVTVTSRHIIKPSTPTSPHNKSYYFSLIDQVSPNFYNSVVLFFENDPGIINNNVNNNVEKKSKLLRESLSEVLVDFYPLAGRIKENELIECNDEGVEFCEAQVSVNLLDFIETPRLLGLKALQPFPSAYTPTHKNIVLSVQINHFSCGGMAIGVCISHKIADAGSINDFFNAWAAKAIHSNHNISVPKFNGASFFPPLKVLNKISFNPETPPSETPATRRLIFNKNMIDELKVQAASHKTVVRPTTIEIVTAFIWKNAPHISSVVHMVNLRSRMVPTLPSSGYFGNFICYTKTCERTDKSAAFLVDDVRHAIKKINNDYIQDSFLNETTIMSSINRTIADLYELPDTCLFFSSTGLASAYEVNFGMGTPIWASLPNQLLKNYVFLVRTKCGQGIEAWISMHEDDIVLLDNSLSQLGYPIVKHIM